VIVGARAFVVLFGISTAFPIMAALLPTPAPTALGLADVGLALLVVVLGFALDARWRPKVTDRERGAAWQVVRIGAIAILMLLALFFLAPSAVRWEILLVGLAWRTWLLVTILPSLVAALQPDAGPPPTVDE
jgi:hypothetical protein